MNPIFTTLVASLFLIAASISEANPGYGPVCVNCHTTPQGSSYDLNGTGAEFARNDHKFPEEKPPEGGESGEPGEAGEEGSAEGEQPPAENAEGGNPEGEGGEDKVAPAEPEPEVPSAPPYQYDNSPAQEGPSSIVAPGEMSSGADSAGGDGGAEAEAEGDPYEKYVETGRKVFSLRTDKLSSVNKSCESCHAPGSLNGAWAKYPRYRGELKRVVTLEQAIQWCLTTNMKGRGLPLDSKYMVALSAFLKELERQ